MNDVILRIKNLNKFYSKRAGIFSKLESIQILEDINLDIKQEQIFGLIGESGSGKSTLAKSIIQITNYDGSIKFLDQELNLLSRDKLNKIKSAISIVFQNPYSSLNPMFKVKDIVAEPLLIQKKDTDNYKLVDKYLELVGISSKRSNDYIHEFSGGQRQRIAIARAIISNPKFIILDEPVSALDVSVQANIINLLLDLKKQLNLSYLFISHNLDLVRIMCDKVAIMYRGRIVETGNCSDIFKTPKHPYTKTLISSIVHKGCDIDQLPNLEINNDNKIQNRNLCFFHSYCPNFKDECIQRKPQLTSYNNTHSFACFNPIED